MAGLSGESVTFLRISVTPLERHALVWTVSYSVDISGSCFLEARDVLKHRRIKSRLPSPDSAESGSSSHLCKFLKFYDRLNDWPQFLTPSYISSLAWPHCGKNISPPPTLSSAVGFGFDNCHVGESNTMPGPSQGLKNPPVFLLALLYLHRDREKSRPSWPVGARRLTAQSCPGWSQLRSAKL